MPDPILIILFIVFFVLPLLEKALKKGKPPPPQQDQRPQRHDAEVEEQQHGALPSGRAPAQPPAEPGPAADMIPDDLWEILTGERRPRPTAERHPRPTAEPEWEREPGEPEPGEPEPERERGYAADRHDTWYEGGRREEEAAPEKPVYETEIAGSEIAEYEIAEDEIAAAEGLRRERERAVHTAERAPQRGADVVIYDPGAPAPRRRASIVAAPPLVPARGGRAAARAPHAVRVLDAPPGERALPAPVRGLRGASRNELRRAFVLKEILDRPKGLE